MIATPDYAEVVSRAEKIISLEAQRNEFRHGEEGLSLDVECIRDLLAIVRQQREVVERLPVTADGVRVGPGSIVYLDISKYSRWSCFGVVSMLTTGWDYRNEVATFDNTPEGNTPGQIETVTFDIEECYSTHEAALAAQEGKPK
jgi:hypothetical protein